MTRATAVALCCIKLTPRSWTNYCVPPSAVCCAMKATATRVQHAPCLQLARCISSEKRSRTLVPTSCTFSEINSRVSCPLAGAKSIPMPTPRPTPAIKLTASRIVWSGSMPTASRVRLVMLPTLSRIRSRKPAVARSDSSRKYSPALSSVLRTLFTKHLQLESECRRRRNGDLALSARIDSR
jgi:hypothetical protein